MYRDLEEKYESVMEDIKKEYGENSKEANNYKKQMESRT